MKALNRIHRFVKSSPSWNPTSQFRCSACHFSLQRTFCSSYLAKPSITVGILRETYNKWERRAPLCPNDVRQILMKYPGSQVLVQPSKNRIFNSQSYINAGALVKEDLSPANLILGVKRPNSLDALIPNKSYMFFSHVIKGQPENMDLLQDVLDKHIELVDYECIVKGSMQETFSCNERKKKRIVAFGKHAGLAGMADTFFALGRRLLMQSYATPFLNCPPTILNHDLAELKRNVRLLGKYLATEGLPAEMEPIVVVMTGKGGNVHSGVREIFDLLPHEMVTPEDLPDLFSKTGPHNKVYGVALETKDIYRRIDDPKGTSFDRDHLQKNPSEYISTFAENIAPYATVIMNCIYWDHRFPRLLTKKDIQNLYISGNERLLVVSDISCDLHGSIEFLERSTTIDHPFFQYDPYLQREVSGDIGDHGVTVMGVDILPTELPLDSSFYFSKTVSRVLQEVFETSNSNDFQISAMSPVLANACITTKEGVLSDNFRYLEAILQRTPKMETDLGNEKMLLLLEGHLFSSGLINQVLDAIDYHECGFEFLECHVRSQGHRETPTKSSAILRISGSNESDLTLVQNKIENLAKVIENADAIVQLISAESSTSLTKGANHQAKTQNGTLNVA